MRLPHRALALAALLASLALAGCRTSSAAAAPAHSDSAASPAASSVSGTYHHIGLLTADPYAQVLGTLHVTPVHLNDNDYNTFVAQRFLARNDTHGDPSQPTIWLEAGWVQSTGLGAPSIYTWSTSTGQWTLYPQYSLNANEAIEIRVTGHPASTTQSDWTADLFWRGAWHHLTTARLPMPAEAIIEAYTEIHSVAPVTIRPTSFTDMVLTDTAGHTQPWGPSVLTVESSYQEGGGYCVRQSSDTLTAYSC